MPSGLTINGTTGKITGYITDIANRKIGITVKGEIELPYDVTLNITGNFMAFKLEPRCPKTDLFNEGAYNSTQEIKCPDEGDNGRVNGRCVVKDNNAVWEIEQADCSNI